LTSYRGIIAVINSVTQCISRRTAGTWRWRHDNKAAGDDERKSTRCQCRPIGTILTPQCVVNGSVYRRTLIHTNLSQRDRRSM